MRSAWILILCASAVLPWPQAGWSQEQPETVGERPAAEDSLQVSARYQAEIARRREELAGLKQKLAQRMAQLRTEYRAGSEYASVVKERDAAREALRLASAQALAPLNADPAYRAAVERRTAAKAKLDQVRSSDASPGAIATAADELLSAANRVANLEAQALRAAPEIATLRLRLGHAEAAMGRLPAATEAFVKADPQYQELAQAVNDTLADIAAAVDDLEYAQSTEPALQDPWSRAEPRYVRGKYPTFDPYQDYTGGKWTYQGMIPYRNGKPDPHESIRRPFPYGQAPPR